MNLRFRGRCLQVLLWWRLDDIKDHWALRIWRWPSGDTLAAVNAEGLTLFGFWAVTVGPFELRYWANSPARTSS